MPQFDEHTVNTTPHITRTNKLQQVKVIILEVQRADHALYIALLSEGNMTVSVSPNIS